MDRANVQSPTDVREQGENREVTRDGATSVMDRCLNAFICQMSALNVGADSKPFVFILPSVLKQNVSVLD